MKKLNIESIVIAAFISIPICIGAIKSQTTKANIMPANTTEWEIQTETFTEVEFIHQVEKSSETATEAVTEPQFVGYDFIPLSTELQVHIFTLCEKYGIDYEIILAVMLTESGYKVDAVGDGGDSIGLMQVQPKWWQGLADEHGLNIYDPKDNAEVGIIILTNALKDNAGDLSRALKQYNAGYPDYPGNEYINRVYANYEWVICSLQ